LYSEFCDAFCPNDSYLAHTLNRRTSNYPVYPRSSPFNHSTMYEFKETWKIHLHSEVKLERIRQSLKRRPFFDVYEAFSACDINQDGVVTKREVQKLLDSQGIYVPEGELNTLVNKYDKDKDGRISFSEFLDEISPKKGY